MTRLEPLLPLLVEQRRTNGIVVGEGSREEGPLVAKPAEQTRARAIASRGPSNGGTLARLAGSLTSSTFIALMSFSLSLVACTAMSPSVAAPLAPGSHAHGRLGVGPTWSCVLPPAGDRARVGSVLGCWGEHPRTEEWWETTQATLEQLARRGELRGVHIGSTSACALDGADELTCWSGEPSCVLDDPGVCGHGPRWRELPVLEGVEHVAVSDGRVCAALATGDVMCAPADAERWWRLRGVSRPADDVIVGDWGRSCVVMGSEVACWGLTGRRASRARSVDYDPWAAYVCARTGGCEDEARGAVDVLAPLRDVDLARGHGCGLDDAGQVWCAWYGADASTRERSAAVLGLDPATIERARSYASTQTNVVTVAVADGHACALTADAKVRCWGDDKHCQTRVPLIYREGHSSDPCETVEVTLEETGERESLDWIEATQRFSIRTSEVERLTRGGQLVELRGAGRSYTLRCDPGPARVPRGCLSDI